jgi:hypothetical protein
MLLFTPPPGLTRGHLCVSHRGAAHTPTESLAGLATIRAFQRQRLFEAINTSHITQSNRAWWPIQLLNRVRREAWSGWGETWRRDGGHPVASHLSHFSHFLTLFTLSRSTVRAVAEHAPGGDGGAGRVCCCAGGRAPGAAQRRCAGHASRVRLGACCVCCAHAAIMRARARQHSDCKGKLVPPLCTTHCDRSSARTCVRASEPWLTHERAPHATGLAGLALTSALNLTGTLAWLVRQVTELEVNMNAGGQHSGERVCARAGARTGVPLCVCVCVCVCVCPPARSAPRLLCLFDQFTNPHSNAHVRILPCLILLSRSGASRRVPRPARGGASNRSTTAVLLSVIILSSSSSSSSSRRALLRPRPLHHPTAPPADLAPARLATCWRHHGGTAVSFVPPRCAAPCGQGAEL